MTDKFILAISEGQIVSVDWRGIQEMLGEEPKREHDCSICSNGSFPPEPMETFQMTEEQISDALSKSPSLYMAEVFPSGKLYMPPEKRFFSACPHDGPWNTIRKG